VTRPSALDALFEVIGALERLGIRYLLGGSFASGIHGVPRATRDADLLVDLEVEQARLLPETLGAAWYADQAMIEDALARGISFNVIHGPTNFKVDCFPVGARTFHRSEMDRRRLESLGEKQVYVSTPEDTLLAKLAWYREGGEVSDRQWQDILGILEVQEGRLDEGHLDRWAAELCVTDLLGRARGEARIRER
jgi:hypothetical protein